jgi:hypothetical protein
VGWVFGEVLLILGYFIMSSNDDFPYSDANPNKENIPNEVLNDMQNNHDSFKTPTDLDNYNFADKANKKAEEIIEKKMDIFDKLEGLVKIFIKYYKVHLLNENVNKNVFHNLIYTDLYKFVVGYINEKYDVTSEDVIDKNMLNFKMTDDSNKLNIYYNSILKKDVTLYDNYKKRDKKRYYSYYFLVNEGDRFILKYYYKNIDFYINLMEYNNNKYDIKAVKSFINDLENTKQIIYIINNKNDNNNIKFENNNQKYKIVNVNDKEIKKFIENIDKKKYIDLYYLITRRFTHIIRYLTKDGDNVYSTINDNYNYHTEINSEIINLICNKNKNYNENYIFKIYGIYIACFEHIIVNCDAGDNKYSLLNIEYESKVIKKLFNLKTPFFSRLKKNFFNGGKSNKTKNHKKIKNQKPQENQENHKKTHKKKTHKKKTQKRKR